MAGLSDPKRFAGKMGIEKGPIPIGRWHQQPSVQVTRAVNPSAMPDGNKEQPQKLRKEKKT